MKNFTLVRPNLYRGSAPTIAEVGLLRDQFDIDVIISLDERTGKLIDKACNDCGIEHIIIPLKFDNKSSVKSLLKYNIADLVNPDLNVFVHCLHGQDRTGLFVALVRCILDKWGCRQALKEAKSFKFGLGIPPEIESFYIKLICHAAPTKDSNFAYDIVSNTSDFDGQYKDYTIDKGRSNSWESFADPGVRTYPFSVLERQFEGPYPNRENYGLKGINMDHLEPVDMPSVGVFDTNTQISNFVGPSLVGGGFV